MGEGREKKYSLKGKGLGMPDAVAAKICAMKIGLVVEDPDDFDAAISAVHANDYNELMAVLQKHLSNAQAKKIADAAFNSLKPVEISNSLDW